MFVWELNVKAIPHIDSHKPVSDPYDHHNQLVADSQTSKKCEVAHATSLA